jgi:hypothetical protein
MLVRRSRASLCPGGFGAASGGPGLVIEERTWLTESTAEFGYEMLQLNRTGMIAEG